MSKAPDPIGAVTVLSKMRNSAEASRLIDMACSAVKGVLRNRGWTVGTVTEFYPNNGNLLGLNVNHGKIIKLRLRTAQNPDVFLPYHDILGTMVHELTHIEISPHDKTFYKLMDELYDEVEGVTSFPFPGTSNVLGGRIGKDSKELIRQAALLRQQKATLFAGSGQKLGGGERLKGKSNLTPAELRAKALEAAERRRDSWQQSNVDGEEEASSLPEGEDDPQIEVVDITEIRKFIECTNDSPVLNGTVNASSSTYVCGGNLSYTNSVDMSLKRRYRCTCCYSRNTNAPTACLGCEETEVIQNVNSKKFSIDLTLLNDDEIIEKIDPAMEVNSFKKRRKKNLKCNEIIEID